MPRTGYGVRIKSVTNLWSVFFLFLSSYDVAGEVLARVHIVTVLSQVGNGKVLARVHIVTVLSQVGKPSGVAWRTITQDISATRAR